MIDTCDEKGRNVYHKSYLFINPWIPSFYLEGNAEPVAGISDLEERLWSH